MAKLDIAKQIDEMAKKQRNGTALKNTYNFYDNIPKKEYLPTASSKKNIASTFAKGAYYTSKIGTGFLKGIEGVSDVLGTGIGYASSGIQSLWDKEGAEKTKDFWKNAVSQNVIQDTIGKAVNNTYGKVAEINSENDLAGDVIEGVAGMLPSIITGNAAAGTVSKIGEVANAIDKGGKTAKLAKTGVKAVSMAPFIAQATGNSIEQALNEGANFDQATRYGIASGLTEGIVESITGYIGGTVSNKVVSKVLSNNATSKAVKEFTSKGIGRFVTKAGDFATDVFSEGFEEVISGALDPIIAKMTYDERRELATSEELQEQFIMGALSSVLLKGAVSSSNINLDSIKNTLNTKVNETKNSLPTNSTNFNKQLLIKNITNSEVHFKDKQEMIKSIKNINNLDDTSYNEINNKIEMLKIQNKEVLNNSNEITLQNNNTLLNTENISNSPYIQSALKYNIDTNNETVRNIENISNERGFKVEYNADVFKDSNVNAIWKVNTDENGNTTREIIINPNSDSNKTLENITIHELTHDLEGTVEYNKLKELVMDYDTKQEEYQMARESLEEVYSQVYDKNSYEFKDLVDNEAVADILGSKLGDQDFINNLSSKDITISRKIYNWVIDKLNKINKLTGYKNQKLYWQDVKNKFEVSFKQDYSSKNTSNSKFSIQSDSNGNKYVKVDTDQDIFKGINKKDYSKVAKEYILSQFRDENKNIILPTAEKIRVTSKTANEYTHPKNKLPFNTNNSKMKASTELDNLVNISQYQYSASDDGRHPFAKDGWEYYKTIFEIDGKVFEGLINIAKNGDKKTLYDITQIKEMSQYSTSDKSFSASVRPSLNNNSITPYNTDVNTTNNYSIQNDTKYSIAGKKAMGNLNNSSLRKAYENAQNMKNIGIGNQEILKSTGWFQDRNGDWKFEFSDKNMKIKENIKLENNKTYKLKDILEHDALFEAYPQLKEYNIKFEYNKDIRKRARYNENVKTITLNSQIISENDSNKKIESSIIHELQHAIQHIESFESGKSSKNKEKYYNSLGEIEAKDVQNRFVNSKYDKSIISIAPESSKSNPMHPSFLTYSKNKQNNKSMLEKVKESVYNYFKGSDSYDEIIEENKEFHSGEGKRLDNVGGHLENWNRLGNEGRRNLNEELAKSSSFSLAENQSFWDNRLNTLYKNENLGNKINDLKKEVNTTKTLSKNERYEKNKTNQFITKLTDKLQVSKYSNKELLNTTINEIKEEIRTNGTLSKDSKTRLFNKLYEELKTVDKTYYTEYKELYNDLKNMRLYLPTTVKSDVDNIKIKTTRNMNAPQIDTTYQELNEMYPSLFPDTINTPAEQLAQMSKIKEDMAITETNLKSYNDITIGPEYKNFAKHDFDILVNELEQDIKLADRYKEAKDNKKSLKDTSKVERIENIKEIFQLQKEYQKQYDKVNNKEVLTEEDRKYLKSLEDGTLTVEELQKKNINLNIKGILNIYNVSKPVKDIKKSIVEYKKQVKAEYYDLAKELTSTMHEWKDKKNGFSYSRETAQRNIYDVVKDENVAKRINTEIFDKFSKNESIATREKNKLVEKINNLELDRTKKYEYKGQKIDEATLAQLYQEKVLNDGQILDYGGNLNKIKKISNTYKQIFDNLIVQMSDTLVANGYAPVEYRKNYFPHFTENKADSFLGKIANLVGIDTSNQELPTNISGITDSFKPGKTWMGNLLQRSSNETDYDALKALDKYFTGSMSIIHHTDDIQRLRTFENVIRESYVSEEMKKQIEKIKDNEEFTEQQKDEAIDIIFDTSNNQLSHFVTWLRSYTDTNANKKSKGDRSLEETIGRNMYTTMANLESRVAANAIGGNIGVSLTNIAPLAQAVGTTKIGSLYKGIIETMASSIKKDNSFVNYSDFLIRRRGTDTLSKTNTEKISEFVSKPMQIIDEFVSEAIVRAKYDENIKNGMNEFEAIESADKYAANLMADRSKGALPTVFNSKNPLSKSITMFQVEVNNTLSNYIKDMSRDSNNKTELIKNYTKLFVGSYIFNTLIKSIRGGNDVLPDPIHWVKEIIQYVFGDKEEKEKAGQSLADNIIGSIPFVSNLAGLAGIEEVGRLPISSAFPNVSKLSDIFGEDISEEYKKEVLIKELSRPITYILLPFGGGQLRKTIEGLESTINGGSYRTNKKGEKELRFAIEDPSLLTYIQAGTLGQYSLPTAKKYVESGFKALTAKETAAYEKSGIPFDTFSKYAFAKELKKKEDKIKFIDNMNLSSDKKYEMYKFDIISAEKRKEDNKSQLDDAEYMIKNGINKEAYIKAYNNANKNNVNMPTEKEFKELKSKNVDLNNYIKYKADTKDTKMPNEKDSKGKTIINSRKVKVINYLISSNLTDKEKSYLYGKEFNNTEFIDKLGIPIDEFLKFQKNIAFIEGDEDLKSNIEGKVLSKSKKNKILKEIVKLDLDPTKKILLTYISGYSIEDNDYKGVSSNTARNKTFNYINNLKITTQEKEKLLQKLGYKKYKNGKWGW